MKSTSITFASAVAVLVALLIPTDLAAQKPSPEQKQPSNAPRYKLEDLGTLGGPQSYVSIPPTSYAKVLNNQGMVAGWADTAVADPFPDFCFDPDCFVAHGFRWQRGTLGDLRALVSGVSSQANWISSNGLIAGVSENGETDPLVTGFPQFHAVLWRNGEIADLGTLEGGYQSFSTAVNNAGQVVGLATNTIPDPDSILGLGFQTRPFLWQSGVMRDLGTLGTGTDAVALLINERGQVAGDSYINSEFSQVCLDGEIGSLSTGAFLWDHGVMTDLGNFGGSCTFVFDLNNRGQVVGGSRLAGDLAQHPFLWSNGSLKDLGTLGGDVGTAIAVNEAGHAAGWTTNSEDTPHATLWRNGRISDLGTLPGDAFSISFDVNERDQVVGISTNDFIEDRAFLWQRGGSMVDLNKVVRGSGLQLAIPETINDRGEIAGIGIDANGLEHAFLLIPCDENAQDDCGQDLDPQAATTIPTPTAGSPLSGGRVNSPRLGTSAGFTRLKPHILEAIQNPANESGKVCTRCCGRCCRPPCLLLDLSPVSINFGEQTVGTLSNPMIATLSNPDTGLAVISKVSTTGPFSLVNHCSTLAPGASCQIEVRFKPGHAGLVNGTLSVTDNGDNSPQRINLSGTGK